METEIELKQVLDSFLPGFNGFLVIIAVISIMMNRLFMCRVMGCQLKIYRTVNNLKVSLHLE